eukprot:3860226-Ditylum_brightwellii.AAC.1
MKDNSTAKDGTSCITLANSCIFTWNQGAYKTTLPLDPFTNTARFYSASGITRYKHFETITQELQQVTTAYGSVAFLAVITESEGEDKSPQEQRGGNTQNWLPNKDKTTNTEEEENIHDFVEKEIPMAY